MEENTICPYPGLRPFNEDESIFFKGREEHIEHIVRQLEEKKFLMLTGASGDGKSSLVYAGVIPHARAGFFKAKFNNWIIADFRPEREPLANLAHVLATQLRIKHSEKLEKELSYGFSSLIDLYKASPFWVDEQTEGFKELLPDDQKKALRRGANLLILVDQFEEFFTNIENFNNGKVSFESQAVVNLLLETTRLAIEQDVPIYIVCTMRSDYIGQCASFRDLPEYIGYSQFFVPRLKRNEIYQVIEAPALLNGNKISKRLVEMLINEMNDGIDQLPVLQHALNQIWQKAEKGTVEMDLIHFAKINGIPKNQLNGENKVEFESWFATLPEFKQQLFENSSLGDVLDAHANELFQTAADNTIGESIENKVSDADAKLIVETTFKCLTKIDEARAVRNRMTLEEITQIINQPHISSTVVASVLNVFRKQGNTFLKPFITEDIESQSITEKSVLDITHESLIRNWNKLTDWAKQEYDNLLTWQDFNKQLERWVKSKKSSGYLLPIGSLTFFETWFEISKPNIHWLARYDQRELSKMHKLEDAEETLANAHQFLKRSARRLFLSRTIIKYGADKIIASFGILLLVISCTYFYFDYRKKQNSAVIETIQKSSLDLLKSKYIKSKIKAEYILTSERLNPGSYRELLENIDSDSSKLEVLRNMISVCINYQNYYKTEKESDEPLVGVLFLHQLELIHKNEAFATNDKLIRNINNLMTIVYEYILINEKKYQPHAIEIKEKYETFCATGYTAVIAFLNDTASLRKTEIDQFSKLLQIVPDLANYDALKLKQVANVISPFNKATKYKFDLLFPKDKTVQQNWQNSLTHNGGYFQLANLYALAGDFNNFNSSLDSLVYHNKNFINASYGCTYYRFLYGLTICNKLLTPEGKKIINKLEGLKTVKSNYSMLINLQNQLIVDGKSEINTWTLQNFSNSDNKAWEFFTQINKISSDQLNELTEYSTSQILSDNKLTEDEKNYMAALSYKGKAFMNNTKANHNEGQINKNIEKALSYYDKVSADYLAKDISVGEGSNAKLIKRSDMFKYPGYNSLSESWSLYNKWRLGNFKDIGVFMNYIANTRGIEAFYLKNNDDAEVLNKFLLNYSTITLDRLDNNYNDTIDSEAFKAIEMNTANKKIDHDLVNSFLILYFNRVGDPVRAKTLLTKVDVGQLLKKEKIESNDQTSQYAKIAYWLASYNASVIKGNNNPDYSKVDSSSFTPEKIIKALPFDYLKRNLLLVVIDSLQHANQETFAISYLDTLLNSYIAKDPKYGNKIFQLLGRIGTNDCIKIAMVLMKDKNDKSKPNCLDLFIKGLAQSDKYYTAFTYIPEYISSSNQLMLYTTLLKNEANKKAAKNDGWLNLNEASDWDWVNSVYENNDGGNVFYSSED